MMVDLEKVIKGIGICLQRFHCGEDCPYYNAGCIEQLRADALSLLKEQEPMEVRLTTSTIRCPKCGKQITSRGAIHREIKFCWKCGQAVKWEKDAEKNL
jgi:endogenous inhibitor of DNA gyrase (YacG/DUF329 family)